LTSRNNEKHITEPFLKIITRRSNGFMAWKYFEHAGWFQERYL
jgi:hypothetical protein